MLAKFFLKIIDKQFRECYNVKTNKGYDEESQEWGIAESRWLV